MGQSHVRNVIHLVYSTKGREPWLLPEIRADLFAYQAGIFKKWNSPAILINGVGEFDSRRHRSAGRQLVVRRDGCGDSLRAERALDVSQRARRELVSDETETNFGFNFTYGIDWFPVEPLVFLAEVDLSSLDEAWLFHTGFGGGDLAPGRDFCRV